MLIWTLLIRVEIVWNISVLWNILTKISETIIDIKLKYIITSNVSFDQSGKFLISYEINMSLLLKLLFNVHFTSQFDLEIINKKEEGKKRNYK